MSDNTVPATKVKKLQRNRHRRKANPDECVNVEPTLERPLEKTLNKKQTSPPKKDVSIKTVQNNSLNKSAHNIIKSCTFAFDTTLDNTIKTDIKRTEVKTKFCSSRQKKSGKLEEAKAPLEKENTGAKGKEIIKEKIKKNKSKLNNSEVLPSTSYELKEKSCIKKSKKCANSGKFKEEFPESIPAPKIKKILKSQKSTNIKYVEGYIRINPKYNKHAYINMPNEEHDLLIVGIRDRNRAFEGDLVVAKINAEDKWQTNISGKKQKTGIIVCILEQIHSRKTVGLLKKVGTRVLLQSRDKRVPLIKIYPESLPTVYNETPSLFDQVLFLAEIKSWKKPYSAFGNIVHMIGTVGDIEVELDAIILENGINIQPFNAELLKELPPTGKLFESRDIADREDWRHDCVFTIDPSTAVDLDDALSCEVKDNGNYEVGVHIADLSHYVKFFSPFDKEVSKRATSVYFAHQVYHMLPDELCKMCSLLPGQDKLAFSVIFELTPDAQIVNHRFSKTIVNSCCQMAYEQAQMIIENSESLLNDILKINGNWTPPDLYKVVKDLFKLSEKLRAKRFADGALRLDQPKLRILIDKESGLPVSYTVAEQTDSNRLIEEFMLLANITVATHLYNTVPEYALLRNHGNPSDRLLTTAQSILQRFGIHLDIESAGDLCRSIKRYELYTELQSGEYKYLAKCRSMVINKLCAKTMAASIRATYYCSSKVSNVEELRHYALNVPFYTHFTSPIRRYADLIVHRLLYSTICTNVKLPPQWNSQLCSEIAKHCNLRKYYAKLAEEQSHELYFTYLIDITGQRTVAGIVFNVREHFIEVILCETGIKVKVYLNVIEKETTIKYDNEDSVPTLIVTWNVSNITQVITIFTIVHLKIEKDTDLFQLNAVLLEPIQDYDY